MLALIYWTIWAALLVATLACGWNKELKGIGRWLTNR